MGVRCSSCEYGVQGEASDSGSVCSSAPLANVTRVRSWNRVRSDVEQALHPYMYVWLTTAPSGAVWQARRDSELWASYHAFLSSLFYAVTTSAEVAAQSSGSLHWHMYEALTAYRSRVVWQSMRDSREWSFEDSSSASGSMPPLTSASTTSSDASSQSSTIAPESVCAASDESSSEGDERECCSCRVL